MKTKRITKRVWLWGGSATAVTAVAWIASLQYIKRGMAAVAEPAAWLQLEAAALPKLLFVWLPLVGVAVVLGAVVFAGLLVARRALAWTVAPRTLAMSVVPLLAVTAIAVSDGGSLCAAYSNVFGWDTSPPAPMAEPAALSASLAAYGAVGELGEVLPSPPANLEAGDCESCLDCGLCKTIRDCAKTIIACYRCAKCVFSAEGTCEVMCARGCGDPRGNPRYSECVAKCFLKCGHPKG